MPDRRSLPVAEDLQHGGDTKILVSCPGGVGHTADSYGASAGQLAPVASRPEYQIGTSISKQCSVGKYRLL
jgi:hypothetical protein